MKTHAMFAGIAGGLLIATIAGGAAAQARYYPDGTNCALLDDAEIVACQNQIYARQLESGESEQVAPAEIPSSHINGNTTGQSQYVPGAEGAPPPASASASGTAPVPGSGLPGPEGTQRGYGPTE